MLTADLVRANVRSGALHLQFLKTDDERNEAMAAAVIRLFDSQVGHTRAELDDALDELVGDSPHFMLARGFAKLLDDRAIWSEVGEPSPVDIRRAIFEQSARLTQTESREGALVHRPAREAVLEAAAQELNLTVPAIERAMYADLKGAEFLMATEELSAAELIDRYNLSLVQAALLRATRVTFGVETERPARFAELFRALKFHQLLFRVRREGSWWYLDVDGPLSVLERSQRYGLQLAVFFPTLLHHERWGMRAELNWPRQSTPITLQLDEKSALRTTRKSRGTWISEEEETLFQRLNKSPQPWRAERTTTLIMLAEQEVLVPDLLLRCEKTGRIAFVEVIGYWRRAWLQRRLELLKSYQPGNVIFCVSRQLAAEREALEGFDIRVVDFAKVIPLGRICEAADAVACAPEELDALRS